MAEAGSSAIDIVYIYFFFFCSFFPGGQGIPRSEAWMSFSSGALWGRPGAPFLSEPLSAFVPSSCLSVGKHAAAPCETDVWVIGRGSECARGFDAAALGMPSKGHARR